MAKHLAEAFAFDIRIRQAAPDPLSAKGVEIDAKEIEQGEIYNDGSTRVSAFLVDHGTVKRHLDIVSILQVTLWSFPETRSFAKTSWTSPEVQAA
jgi:hypothetical protein